MTRKEKLEVSQQLYGGRLEAFSTDSATRKEAKKSYQSSLSALQADGAFSGTDGPLRRIETNAQRRSVPASV